MEDNIFGDGQKHRNELPVCHRSASLPHEDIAELIEISPWTSPPTIRTMPFRPTVELAKVDLVSDASAEGGVEGFADEAKDLANPHLAFGGFILPCCP